MTPAFVLYAGRTHEVVAQAKVNGIPSLVIRDDRAVITIPLAVAVVAPVRSRPVLVWSRP